MVESKEVFNGILITIIKDADPENYVLKEKIAQFFIESSDNIGTMRIELKFIKMNATYQDLCKVFETMKLWLEANKGLNLRSTDSFGDFL